MYQCNFEQFHKSRLKNTERTVQNYSHSNTATKGPVRIEVGGGRGGGGGWRRKWGVPKFFKGVGGGS